MSNKRNKNKKDKTNNYKNNDNEDISKGKDQQNISDDSDINSNKSFNYQFVNNSFYRNNLVKSVEAMSKLSQNMSLQISEAIPKLTFPTNFISNIGQTMKAVLDKIDYSYVLEGLSSVASAIQDKIDENIKIRLLEAKWFPGYRKDSKFNSKLWSIVINASSKRQRNKSLDKLFFSYFSKNRIEKMRKLWNKEIVEYSLKKVLKHSLDAYYAKQYALTVTTLSTIWEGIIYEKVNKASQKRKTKNTNKYISFLTDDLKNGDIINDYFNEYVYYQIEKKDQVIEDAPGRHASAHAWYKKYPTRKAALNAILITDFLINLSQKDFKSN